MPRKYEPTAAPFLSNERLPAERPIHLACGMAVIAEFSAVEGHVSLLLTALAKGDPEPVAAIYSVLRQGQIQAKALSAVASQVLDADDVALLSRLMKVIRTASDDRDALAHRLWFFDRNLPDAVVLADPAIIWRTDHEVKVGGGTGPTTVEHAERIQGVMRDACVIWRGDDFDVAQRRAAHASIGLQAFRLMVIAETAAAKAEERQKVLNILDTASF